MLRLAVSAPFFCLALLFLVRSVEPLRLAFSAGNRPDPPGFFLTVFAIGISLAALCFAVGGVIVSARARRYGGLLVVSLLAVAASALPRLVFKWTVAPDTLPWVHFAQDGIVFLGLGQRTFREGLLIQTVLSEVALGTAVAQVIVWRRRAARTHE